jgi:hypothetical protein
MGADPDDPAYRLMKVEALLRRSGYTLRDDGSWKPPPVRCGRHRDDSEGGDAADE